jgi:hypothetical protein
MPHCACFHPELSRLCPPLHRNLHVYFKSVRAATIAAPDVVRGSDGLETLLFLCSTLLVMLGTFAPELERETGILFHAVAFIVAVSQSKLSHAVSLGDGRLVPFDGFLHVRRVEPIPTLVTSRGAVLGIGVTSFFCRPQILGRRLPLVTLDPFAPRVKSAKVELAHGVPSLCCHATKLECQREVFSHTLLAKGVAVLNESLRLECSPSWLSPTARESSGWAPYL